MSGQHRVHFLLLLGIYALVSCGSVTSKGTHLQSSAKATAHLRSQALLIPRVPRSQRQAEHTRAAMGEPQTVRLWGTGLSRDLGNAVVVEAGGHPKGSDASRVCVRLKQRRPKTHGVSIL